MRASASAGAPAISRSALIGERADLTYDYDYLGAGPETLARSRRRRVAALRRPSGRSSLIGQGALARPDGAAIARAGREGRASKSARSRTAGTASRVLHTAAVARRRARSRLRAGGRRRSRPPQMAQGRRARRRCSCSAPTRSTSRPARSSSTSARMATAARIAPTSSCRAPPIRKSPASMSTPKAACRWPRAPLPAGRRARGLGDPARAVRRARAEAALRLACAAARRAVQARIRISRASTRSRPATRPRSRSSPARGGTPDKAPFRSPVDGLLSDQSDRARLRHHGGMLGAGARPAAR